MQVWEGSHLGSVSAGKCEENISVKRMIMPEIANFFFLFCIISRLAWRQAFKFWWMTQYNTKILSMQSYR